MQNLFKTVLLAQVAQIKDNTAKVLRSDKPEFLHDLRVAALRANFALKFFKKSVGKRRGKMAREKLKRSRGIMGRARDLDIVLSRAGKYPRIKKALQPRKAKARRELVKMLRSSWYKSMLDDLRSLAEDHKAPQARPRDLHQIRIALKELRYACEFLGMKKAIRRIVKLQNVLGEHEDALGVVRVLSRLNTVDKTGGRGRLIKLEKHRASDAQNRFRKMWEDVQMNEGIWAL